MQLHLATMDLAAAVAIILETQRPRAVAKQQALHWQNEAGSVPVLADASVLTQVVENLVSNAIKYSPPGKNIFVRLNRSAQATRCEVRDEGPGLSAEDQKKLFRKNEADRSQNASAPASLRHWERIWPYPHQEAPVLCRVCRRDCTAIEE